MQLNLTFSKILNGPEILCQEQEWSGGDGRFSFLTFTTILEYLRPMHDSYLMLRIGYQCKMQDHVMTSLHETARRKQADWRRQNRLTFGCL